MPDAPAVGDLAPDFALADDSGATVRLSDFRGRRVIIFFYPKDDTPGCTSQACGLRDAWPTFEGADAVVLGISPDSAASHRKFRTKFDLPYPLLVDADHAVALAYGAWGEKSMYGKKYQGILRSHFVIGPDGRIEDAQVKVSPADSVERAVASIVASTATG
jgi:peroxiredoxin Q/BCP